MLQFNRNNLNKMKRYYTYAYLREDRTPYYIGKGSGNRAYSKHTRKNKRIIPIPPKNRILILKRFENELQAFSHEEYMIFLYGRECDGGILLNITLGGGGFSIYKTDEERKLAIRKSSIKFYYNDPNVKEYRRKKRAEYRQKNKEDENKKYRELYARNPEKYKEKRKKYYEKNKEMIKQKRKEYYYKNKNT